MNKMQFSRRLVMMVFGLILSLPLLMAQNKTVRGTVIDDTDQPVIGAAVMVKGTSNGVATDIDGKFEINCAPADVLVISSIGYDEVEMTVGDRTEITVRLEISQELLDDVVVIGYGTTRAKNFTGSVDVVKMSESPVADLGLSNVSDMTVSSSVFSSDALPARILRNSSTTSQPPSVSVSRWVPSWNSSHVSPDSSSKVSSLSPRLHANS